MNFVTDTLFIENWHGGNRSSKSYLATISSKGNKYYLALIDSSDGRIKEIFETTSNMNLLMENKIYSVQKRELMKDSIANDMVIRSKIKHRFSYKKDHPYPLEMIFICGDNVCSRNQITNEIKLIKE